VAACAGQPTPIPDRETPSARLYAARCGACHSVPHPKRQTGDQWGYLLSLMETNMEHRDVQPLSPDERDLILSYLETHAR
jgi:hypothetical protein